MIQVKRNSSEFKEVKEILEAYEKNGARKRAIRLYALKPFESLEKKILINDVKKDKEVIYAITYDTLLEYVRFNKEKKLFRENDGLYYFKSNAKSKWMEFPFELSPALKRRVRPLAVVK
jgi:hypothetical protein